MVEDELVHKLRGIQTFTQLKNFLSKEMDWPIGNLEIEDLTFDYNPEELGLKPKHAAKIKVIKRLRSLAVDQPWGIFFIEFEKKNISVEVLRRILGHVAVNKRASKNDATGASWSTDDLLFISNYGETNDRRISFAQFLESENKRELAKLKVLAWDSSDAALHLGEVARKLTAGLSWPEDESDTQTWRLSWRSAFELGHREVIRTSETLAYRLAGLATSIRQRMIDILESETENGPFQNLLKGFRDSLVEDLDVESFSDMYAQTITYGLLSARIAGANLSGHEDFSMHLNASPFLRDLMESLLLADGSRGHDRNLSINFDELGIQDVVDELNAARMEDIVRNFGDKNFNEDPVTHFYETFLSKYNPLQRIQRGVFYTPQSVVRNIVNSVHDKIKNTLGLEDGLASAIKMDSSEFSDYRNSSNSSKVDEFVINILDPATGTGTFLVEVIEKIYQTLVDKWKLEGLNKQQIANKWSEYVPESLLPRIVGYELLMAPYAIAHLKISIKLLETGYVFKESDRIQIFLTNALSGPRKFDESFDFAVPAISHEAHAVNKVKTEKSFSVVIGNPPYSGISSNMTEDAAALIEEYKFVDGEHFAERKHWLQDDYVKFLRIAEMQIEKTGFGIVGYITNHAFIDNPTFRGLRFHFLGTFNEISILDLHGNVMKQEAPPVGLRNENVFDIQQGVAIALLSRSTNISTARTVNFGEIWGTREEKYKKLSESNLQDLCKKKLLPKSKFYFFCPYDDEYAPEYSKWPQLNEIFNIFAGGFITARDHFVVDINKEELLGRISELRSKKISDDEIRKKYFAGMGASQYPDGDSRGWKLPIARQKVMKDADWQSHIRRCLYRPFDSRWIYWTDSMVDWPRPETNGHLLNSGNIGLVFMRQVASSNDYTHVMVSRDPVDARACYSNKGIMSLAPLYLHRDSNSRSVSLFDSDEDVSSNLLPSFRDMFKDFDAKPGSHLDNRIFHYMYGILNSNEYRTRYISLLKVDYPRIPIPSAGTLYNSVADIGEKIAALQLLEVEISLDNQPKYVGPSAPTVGKVHFMEDTLWFNGTTTSIDSASAGFVGVSKSVYEFEIGGYRVCEKWFKDRRGLQLNLEEIEYAMRMLGSISLIIEQQVMLDSQISKHGGFPGAFVI